MKKIFFLLCILLVACQLSKNENTKKTVKINIQSEPQSLDPRKARELNSISIVHMLFEGLTRIMPNGTVEKALAKEILQSSDGKIFTFKLRSAHWSNGDKVTSFDFTYTWKKILAPDFPSSLAYQLYIIKNAKEIKEGILPQEVLGVTTPDEKTLIVELKAPVFNFLQLLSSPIFAAINRNVDKQNPSWSYSEQSYVCNGPFKLRKWQHNELIEIIKNNSYWDKENVKINALLMLMLSITAEYNMFKKGEIDWAGSPLSTLAVDVLKDENVQIKPFMATAFLRINTHYFPESTIRRTLSCTIDREEIVKSLQAKQIPSHSLVPGSNFPAHVKDNIIMNKPEITLTYVNQERPHLTAQILQRQWMQALNINIKLEAVESKVFYERISKGKYEIALGSWIADADDPLNFLEVFKYKGSTTNNTFWENAQYQHLLNQVSLTQDEKLRKILLQEAEKLLLTEQPIIPLYHLTLNFLQNKKIKNVYISPTGVVDFKWAYVE